MSWIKPPEGAVLTLHFHIGETVCHHCGKIPDLAAVLDTALMMESIRTRLGNVPIKVVSWCRCPVWNARVGGAPHSYHIKGMAVDFTLKGKTPRQVQALLKAHEGGLGSYAGWTHADRGPRRRWSG